jgi:hypothetical protein
MKLMTSFNPLIDLASTKMYSCLVFGANRVFCVHTFLYVERPKLKQVKL